MLISNIILIYNTIVMIFKSWNNRVKILTIALAGVAQRIER